jgi:hypothetical protein
MKTIIQRSRCFFRSLSIRLGYASCPPDCIGQNPRLGLADDGCPNASQGHTMLPVWVRVRK